MGWFGVDRATGDGSWAARAGSKGCVALVALLGACGPQLPGVITPAGYKSGRYALDVRRGSDAPQSLGLMPDGWKLDNFNGSDPKTGEAYQTTFHIDWDGDGDAESSRQELAFELRFVHLRHAGVVWLRAVPVSPDSAKKDLRVLTQSFVEALAGGEYELMELNPGRLATTEKRFASTLLGEQSCRLAGLDCDSATIELANVDQLKLDPSYRSNRLQVVITRTSFVYAPTGEWGPSYPVYLVAGYSNQPAQFAAGLPDFAGLLQRIEIGGHRGFQPTPSSPQ
jgi:hypothetical protein